MCTLQHVPLLYGWSGPLHEHEQDIGLSGILVELGGKPRQGDHCYCTRAGGSSTVDHFFLISIALRGTAAYGAASSPACRTTCSLLS